MTKFLDGPAMGTTLMLKRVPKMLRVTEVNGVFDALNELNDEPHPDEKLHCYVMSQYLGSVHVNRGKGKGGFYQMAEYKLRQQQPTDAEMRDNKAWGDWCESTPEAADITGRSTN